MKKNFLTGLAILLPIVLTTIIVMFFVNILTAPFLGLVNAVFGKLGLLDSSFFFVSGTQVATIISKILVLITLGAFTLIIGFLARHFFLEYIFKATDILIHKIPVINTIYKAIQEVMNTIFHPESTTFSQVALVPYPYEGTYAIAFIARTGLPEDSDANYHDFISVFVPGTPNPTVGFNLLFKKEQLIFLDIPVNEALKLVISCGVMNMNFNDKTVFGKLEVEKKS